jgi:hypothetical protein
MKKVKADGLVILSDAATKLQKILGHFKTLGGRFACKLVLPFVAIERKQQRKPSGDAKIEVTLFCLIMLEWWKRALPWNVCQNINVFGIALTGPEVCFCLLTDNLTIAKIVVLQCSFAGDQTHYRRQIVFKAGMTTKKEAIFAGKVLREVSLYRGRTLAHLVKAYTDTLP